MAAVCASCLRRAPAFDAAWAAVPFQALSRELVHQLKYQGRLASATVLAYLLAERLRERKGPWPHVMVPVPLHRRRLRKRGFNQAAELARVLAEQVPVAVDTTACLRVRDTVAQTGLSGVVERRRNLDRAFEVRRNLQAMDTAIVDDVVTTGATVSELAKALKRAGARRVEVWSVCRANL